MRCCAPVPQFNPHPRIIPLSESDVQSFKRAAPYNGLPSLPPWGRARRSSRIVSAAPPFRPPRCPFVPSVLFRLSRPHVSTMPPPLHTPSFRAYPEPLRGLSKG